MRRAIDMYMVYQFIRRLSRPFEKWDAYKTGVIDQQGNILVRKPERTSDQQKSFTSFDLMVLKLKKLLGKVPGGSTRIASYMAALWLIKEWNHFTEDSILTENVSSADISQSLSLFSEWYLYYIPVVEEVNRKITEDGEAPTVNVGSGNIAGLGVGPQGEPGLTKAQQARHKKRAAATSVDLARRKTFASFIGEASPEEAGYYTQDDGNEPDRINVERHRRFKKHPKPTRKDT